MFRRKLQVATSQLVNVYLLAANSGMVNCSFSYITAQQISAETVNSVTVILNLLNPLSLNEWILPSVLQ